MAASRGGVPHRSGRGRYWTACGSGIDEILQEWSARTTGKQRITGTLVHTQLLREGYRVGGTTVRA